MSMTKKDYTQIAAVIKRYRKPFTSFDVEYTGEDWGGPEYPCPLCDGYSEKVANEMVKATQGLYYG